MAESEEAFIRTQEKTPDETPALVKEPSIKPGPVPIEAFHPKPDTDYVAHIADRVMVKSRSHEKLVRDFGEWGRAHGFIPSTPHPIDLVLTSSECDHLVEAKVVYRENVAEVVRAAIGQLMDYRYFLYALKGRPPPSLLALFSAPIGEAYAGLLSSLDISPVWLAAGAWAGTLPEARQG
jgi:hypothetical protein